MVQRTLKSYAQIQSDHKLYHCIQPSGHEMIFKGDQRRIEILNTFIQSWSEVLMEHKRIIAEKTEGNSDSMQIEKLSTQLSDDSERIESESAQAKIIAKALLDDIDQITIDDQIPAPEQIRATDQ